MGTFENYKKTKLHDGTKLHDLLLHEDEFAREEKKGTRGTNYTKKNCTEGLFSHKIINIKKKLYKTEKKILKEKLTDQR